MGDTENEIEWYADFRARMQELFGLFMNMIRWVYQEIPPVGTRPMAFSVDMTLRNWLDQHSLMKAYRREAAIIIEGMALDLEMSDTVDDFLNIELPSISLAAVKTFIAMDHEASRFRFFCYLLRSVPPINRSAMPAIG